MATNKDYLIKFQEDGSRGATYANGVHYLIKPSKPIIEIDGAGIKKVTGYTEEIIEDIAPNFNHEQLLSEGYEWIEDSIYQKLLGNYDGTEYIKQGNEFIPKPPYVPTLEELKEQKIQQARNEFINKRDAIRWVAIDETHTYGFDCASEDITNFNAAFLGLSNDLNKNGKTLYKVWIDQDTKGVVALDLNQMTKVYNEVRNSQFQAYAWYEQIKSQIESCPTKEGLDKIEIQ